MFQKKHSMARIILAAICMTLLITSAAAAEITVDPDAHFCFSADDFSVQDPSSGVFITSVPNRTVAEIRYGNRLLKAGDALPFDALNQLTMKTSCPEARKTAIQYCIVSNGTAGMPQELSLSILPKKNEPPEAEDGELETYRNIANSGELDASDPENGKLTYQLVTAPKRGTVEIFEDGTFTYTPDENKVGKDSFTFTVTDDAGQTSKPAKVSIEIKKPSDKRMYADLSDERDVFSAMWMKEEGLFSGSSVGEHLCFGPDEPVSRGEFLVMVMKLVDAEADQTQMRSGFADEASTPLWMQPYIVSALSNGMITGTQLNDHMVFRPEAQLTQAEAAVMLQNILQLPGSSVQAVSAIEDNMTIPVWAESAAAALSSAGIELDLVSDETIMTRRDAANVLYQVNSLLKRNVIPTFYWAQ